MKEKKKVHMGPHSTLSGGSSQQRQPLLCGVCGSRKKRSGIVLFFLVMMTVTCFAFFDLLVSLEGYISHYQASSQHLGRNCAGQFTYTAKLTRESLKTRQRQLYQPARLIFGRSFSPA